MTQETKPQTTTSSKTCPKCGVTKGTEAFSKDKYKKDGLASQCKACKSESTRKWQKENPEKAREYDRKWREANPEKRNEYNRKWRAENPEYVREANRKWREANLEQERERRRKHYAENAEQERARGRKYYAENIEQERERCRKWREENPEKRHEYAHKWREANPDKAKAYGQKRMARLYRNVARVRKLMAHFEGRNGWMEKLAGVAVALPDAHSLTHVADDIDELLSVHYYKEV